MSLTARITAALDKFSDVSTPPTSPFADVCLMWMSPLADGGAGGKRYVLERMSSKDPRALMEKVYTPVDAIQGERSPVTPPHTSVLRVTPSLFYTIPAWRYQTASFSFFVWVRLLKFYTQRAVILADWTAPKCFLFSVTKERQLSLELRGPTPALYNGGGHSGDDGSGSKNRFSSTSSVAMLVDETEPLLEVVSKDGDVVDDVWNHIGFSYDMTAGRAALYVNGQKVAEARPTGRGRSLPFHLRPTICLGHTDSEKPGTKDAGCFGFLSDARFYRGAVHLDELLKGR